MPPNSKEKDPRKVMHGKIHAKATFVTSEAECARLFGSNKKTKMLNGVVHQVERRKTQSGRTQFHIHGMYAMPDGSRKEKTLNIASVKPGWFVESDGTSNIYPRPGSNPASTAAAAPLPAAAPAAAPAPAVATAAPPPTAPAQPQVENRNTTVRNAQRVLFDVTTTGKPTLPPQPTVECHGVKWYSGGPGEVIDLGEVSDIQWKMKNAFGDFIYPGCGKYLSRLDAWLLMWGNKNLDTFFKETNEELKRRGHKEFKGMQEAIKFQGVMRLCTRYEFGSRDSLWSHKSKKYMDAPRFGKTGMSRDRFNEIFSCQRYSVQPSSRPDDVSSEQYRWMLVDDHVANFNEHRAACYHPSDTICVDESISRWYGLGGGWINAGLPQYISIDRKPEDGCEIQDSADGKTGIMMQLKLVKTEQEDATNHREDLQGLNHGTQVWLELTRPWWHKKPRVIVADSYFASVQSCDEAKRRKLKFIGVVKTATSKFPMAHLSSVELQERGDVQGLFCVDDDGKLDKMAYLWMDRDRRYFISNTSSLHPGQPYVRQRLRQVDTSPNAEPEHVTFSIPQPKAAERYYSGCARIDQSNRVRQDDFQLERKLGTLSWDIRVNHSILGINDVDTYYMGRQMDWWDDADPDEFYYHLAEEMIDNTFDARYPRRGRPQNSTASRSRSSRSRSEASSTTPESIDSFAHCTPTDRKRKCRGVETNHAHQARCKICTIKSGWRCSICGEDVALCHRKTGRDCLQQHNEEVHL